MKPYTLSQTITKLKSQYPVEHQYDDDPGVITWEDVTTAVDDELESLVPTYYPSKDAAYAGIGINCVSGEKYPDTEVDETLREWDTDELPIPPLYYLYFYK